MFTSDSVRIWVGRKLKGIECQRRLWVCIVELFEGGLIAFLEPLQADDKKRVHWPTWKKHWKLELTWGILKKHKQLDVFEGGLIAFLKPFQADDKKEET